MQQESLTPDVRVRAKPAPPTSVTDLVLRNMQAPGDVLVMSAALDSLHLAYPGEYRTDVLAHKDYRDLYAHHPKVTPLPEGREIHMVYGEKPNGLIHHSNRRLAHFMHAYTEHLGRQIGREVPLLVNRPSLHFSPAEMRATSLLKQRGIHSPYWVVSAGTKRDFTAKGWGHHNYQKLVTLLQGQVLFAQVGQEGHLHRPLRGVVNLLGQTKLRELVLLCRHAVGGLGPSTLVQHVFAALQKPYVCLLGGREPLPWVSYPVQTTLHTLGALSCCKEGACWKSRIEPLGDNTRDDQPDKLCQQPVFRDEGTVPRCMDMIAPEEVAAAIRRYHDGGAHHY